MAATSPKVSATTQPAGAQNTPPDALVTVRRGPLRKCATAVGTLRASQTTQISSQVSGQIKGINVDVGKRVKTGDVLVELDPVFFEIEIQQLKASVEAATAGVESKQANLRDSERELKRQQDIFAKGAGSVKERDDAATAQERSLAELTEQMARVKEMSSALSAAQRRLREATIRAPYDAVVTRRLVDPGESVAVNPPTYLLEVQDVGTLYLEFSLPQELLSTISPGRRVEFEIEGIAGFKGEGEISVVFPSVDEATRSFRCRVVLKNQDLTVRPGLLTAVRVVEQEVPDAIIVPRSTIRRAAGGWEVRVLRSGLIASQPVELGLLTDDSAQILQGLTEGQQIELPEWSKN